MKSTRSTGRLLLRRLAPGVTVAALAVPAQAWAQKLVNGCSPDAPALCAYASPERYAVGVADLYLEDGARGNHPVPIRVRYPKGATGARPVVIWNHGGGTTGPDQAASAAAGFLVSHGQQGSVRRSESFARAGYVVVHIGRMEPRELSSSQLQDCFTAAGTTGDTANPDEATVEACRVWTGWHRYGPLNVAFLASLLPYYRQAMLPGFDGTLDRERVVVGGWSGGTEATLNVAGASQRWGAPGAEGPGVVQPPVPVAGVVAFFADAPRGPAWAGYTSGFQEDSAYGIDGRPFLFNTARDDRGPEGGPVVSRNVHFFGAAKGGKVLSYSWTPADAGGPNHGTVDINDEPGSNGCNTALREEHCGYLESLGVAFLDAAAARRPSALEWMASDNFDVLTGGRIELHTR